MLLFWAPQKRLNKVSATKLSCFLLFLRAYYVQKVCTQLLIKDDFALGASVV